MTRRTPKRAAAHHARQKLIPVVSDLEALHRCAARTICEMARSQSAKLADLTLAELRAQLEQELIDTEQAIEEIDLLITEQGADQRALRLDLQPASRFSRLRARCGVCR
jgi:hypothetical protein